MSYSTLVSAEVLARHLDHPDWVIFDCRHDLAAPEAGRQAYRVAHIPGARFAHLDEDLSGARTGANGRHPLPATERFADWLSRMGVDRTKQVVVYDDASGMFAARLWWMLRWLGQDPVAVLDGGFNVWLHGGYPVTSDPPQVTPARFVGGPRQNHVDADHVLEHLHNPAMMLVDARSPERFRGVGETLDPVGGHIPGARNRFFKSNLEATGLFKPAATLKSEFSALLGGALAEAVVHSCGSGVTACHNLLAMEIAGLSGSRLYPGSWSEWCADPTRPMVRS
jgi:thiosulfate/3-mercaptopyruvate sulfurtransferase